jgi:hypothetical protein
MDVDRATFSSRCRSRIEVGMDYYHIWTLIALPSPPVVGVESR